MTQSQHISIYLYQYRLFTINYQQNIHCMIPQITIQISRKTHRCRILEKSRQQCALPPGTTLPAAGNLLAPRCPEPRPAWTNGSVLTVIPRRITAGTLPTTSLPQQRPKRHAISQRAILRLKSTVDYNGSLKNDHYWPNLQGVGQTSFAPKPV